MNWAEFIRQRPRRHGLRLQRLHLAFPTSPVVRALKGRALTRTRCVNVSAKRSDFRRGSSQLEAGPRRKRRASLVRTSRGEPHFSAKKSESVCANSAGPVTPVAPDACSCPPTARGYAHLHLRRATRSPGATRSRPLPVEASRANGAAQWAAGAVLRFTRWPMRESAHLVSNTVVGTERTASGRDGSSVVRGRGRRIPPAATNCYTTDPRGFVKRHRTPNAVGFRSGSRVCSSDIEGWAQDFQSRVRSAAGIAERPDMPAFGRRRLRCCSKTLLPAVAKARDSARAGLARC